MKTSGIILDKELRKTVFISMALHLFCFSFVSFTFVDKIKYSLDLPIDFLGPILIESDILAGVNTTTNYAQLDIIDRFFSMGNLKKQDYRIMVNKPYFKPQNLFMSTKPFTQNMGISAELKFKQDAGSKEVEGIERSPVREEDLKLKIK